MIPLIDLGAQQARIRDKIDAGISRVLDHGMYIMGPEISAIEDRLASFTAQLGHAQKRFIHIRDLSCQEVFMSNVCKYSEGLFTEVLDI